MNIENHNILLTGTRETLYLVVRDWRLGIRSGLKGHPVQLRDCPAAVSENDLRSMHWFLLM